MHGTKVLMLATALAAGAACSVIIDLTLEVDCFCGERWKAQVSGAHGFQLDGTSYPIFASETNYATCVTQLEHLALEVADPGDPIYMAISTSLENAALAQCEVAGAAQGGPNFSHTDCATAGTANFVHDGTCWDHEVYPLDVTDSELCVLNEGSACIGYYDCSSQPIWNEDLDDEAGEDLLLWECDDPAGFSELEIQQ